MAPAPAIAPFPADYVAIAARSVQRDDSARYEVSEPRQMPDWSMNRGQRWYVCIRRDGGTPEAMLLGSSVAETRIADTDGQFCRAATYQPFTPTPNAMPVRMSLGPKLPFKPRTPQ
jgi:hypothetical protein